MRLNYKILWFENDDSFYDSLNLDEIRSHLGNNGFEATVERKTGEEPIAELISDAQKSDLIVMDFALEGAQQGDDLIVQIRDGNIYSEIVFYSAAGVSRLRDRVRERDMDGVYCRGRDDITTDLMPIIDYTIRKVLDLENSRGLVMAELGELDLLMNEIIVKVHDSSDEKKNFIRGKMKEKLDGQAKSVNDQVANFDALSINEIVDTALDSNKRLTTMISIVKKLNLEQFKERLNGYKESVLFPRNCLGHGVAAEVEEGGYVFRHGNKEFLFNDQSNTKLRNDLRDFGSCLHELQAEILAESQK
jgi:hypothetical protein